MSDLLQAVEAGRVEGAPPPANAALTHPLARSAQEPLTVTTASIRVAAIRAFCAAADMVRLVADPLIQVEASQICVRVVKAVFNPCCATDDTVPFATHLRAAGRARRRLSIPRGEALL